MSRRNPWFTSDPHYDHEKVIVYSKRPFLDANGNPDVGLMNRTLIQRWNECVKPDDEIYVVGDISCGSTPEKVYEHLIQLNGIKYWIPGNHDKTIRKSTKIVGLFKWVKDLAEISVPYDPTNPHKNQRIVLCHYAMRVWNKSHYGAWQLYGHSHGNLKDDPHALQLDVGVDEWDYRPVSFEQIKERMARKTFKPVDHHGVWPPSPDSSKNCSGCGQVNFIDNKTCGNCGIDI